MSSRRARRAGQCILIYGAAGSIGTAGVHLAASFDAHVTLNLQEAPGFSHGEEWSVLH
jgi:NADPH:quinone reductase-like Zn-dependent oxidoreductase